VYRYELKDGIITIAKEGEDGHHHYSYTFSGNTVTLTPFHHGERHEAEEHTTTEHAAAEPEGAEHAPTEHTPSGGHQMGALPESPVTFTHAR
jgi:hypothetical protein